MVTNITNTETIFTLNEPIMCISKQEYILLLDSQLDKVYLTTIYNAKPWGN